MNRMIAVLVLTLLPLTGFAEIRESAANGFSITTNFTTKASPAEVYRKILAVGDWWSSEHTYSGDAHNLSIDTKAGGCWCERLPKSGGSVMHMQVATLMPGALLVFTGGLGPLQQMGVSGAMTFKLVPASGGTQVEFSYVVSGYHPLGLNSLAPLVDKVLMEAVSRLHNYIDLGDPATKK